ncbi:MAG: hypothetical protein MJ211_00065 [Bacteroidales bacterium]|nr:hypothetical protein [Bacteroidales bacterium]
MNSAEKKLFLSKLASESDELLLKTLDFFRSNGDIDVLPNVLNLIDSGKGQIVTDAVLNFVSDLKNKDAANVVFDFMINNSNKYSQKQLITALWQCDVDFSDKAEIIIDFIFNTDNFEMAFDALTLLENNASNIEKDIADCLFDKVCNWSKGSNFEFDGIYNAVKEHLMKIINNNI